MDWRLGQRALIPGLWRRAVQGRGGAGQGGPASENIPVRAALWILSWCGTVTQRGVKLYKRQASKALLSL